MRLIICMIFRILPDDLRVFIWNSTSDDYRRPLMIYWFLRTRCWLAFSTYLFFNNDLDFITGANIQYPIKNSTK